MEIPERHARYLYGVPLAICGAMIVAYHLDANAPIGWLFPRFALGFVLLGLGVARTFVGQRLPNKVVEYHDALSLAVVLALFLRTFCVQAFKIPSGSMEKTLLVGDHLLVNKMLYGIRLPGMREPIFTIREPQRGDIVVFKYPKDETRDFIKRLVGLPGDTIEIRNKRLYVNGVLQDEPYAQWTDRAIYPHDNAQLGPRDNFGPYHVPPQHYFFMGDNRDNSHDSRFWGSVPREKLVGKAMVIYVSCNPENHLPRLTRTGRLTQ
jgi:signal peptidase I